MVWQGEAAASPQFRAARQPHPSLKNKGLDMGWAGSAVNISRAHKS
jgi:hypothetical protein